MALTKVSTDGVKDDAITSGKIPANAVGASELADNAVDTNAIANNAVTAGKTSGVQTTINNNADNRVITGSGTANTLNAESGVIIDTNGKVGIGTSSPDHFLEVKSSAQNANDIITQIESTAVASGLSKTSLELHKGSGYGAQLSGYIDQGVGSGFILSTLNAGTASEKLRVDSSGKIIQRYSVPPYNDRALTLQSPSGQTTTALAIVNTETNGQSNIVFGDHAGQNAGNFTGFMSYNHQYNDMRFGTNGGQERLRIQSNGDVYLNPTQGSTGVSSGAIRRFNAGLDYWSGTAGSSNAIKYAVHGAGDDNMYGIGISGSLLELQSQVDIGFFAGSAGNGTGRRIERARILATGGLTFNGDTAADNAIDDYEEGSWTPSLNSGGGSVTVYSAKYTKIGRQVAIQFYIQFNSTSGNTNQCILNGLPFTVQSAGWTASHLATAYSRTNIHCRASSGSTQVDIKGDADGTVTYAQLNGAWALSSFVYFTT